MAYFGTHRMEGISSILELPRDQVSADLVETADVATLEDTRGDRFLSFATERGTVLSEHDLADQFIPFQFSRQEDGATIVDSSQVTPTRKGSEAEPDALTIMQLTSFHVGSGDEIDKNTRATLRLDFGKDPASRSYLDTVFWSIAAGLNLYNDTKKQPSEARDLRSDFGEAFSRRPIEVPGGLGRLSFEVLKHKEPSWWKKIFIFIQSGTGRALTAAIGFPAITAQAVGFVDQLLDEMDKSDPEVLFRSRPMTLALTERARDEFTGGVPGVSVGVLNPGFCLLARGRDYSAIVEHRAVYMGAYGLLKPMDMPLEQFLQEPAANPFNSMTYAVIKVGTRETRLNPQLDFGG